MRHPVDLRKTAAVQALGRGNQQCGCHCRHFLLLLPPRPLLWLLHVVRLEPRKWDNVESGRDIDGAKALRE